MTQKERQERSKREIFLAAMKEFGSKSYDAVTMDGICVGHGISKGMMYHYYANKDELFLHCIQVTFQDLHDNIRPDTEALIQRGGVEAMKQYFCLREDYFQQHPMEKHVFENALLNPPQHLRGKIWELRRPMRELNRKFVWEVVSRMPLRRELPVEAVTRYLDGMEYCLQNALRQYQMDRNVTDVHTLMQVVGELMDMFLYGVIQQR